MSELSESGERAGKSSGSSTLYKYTLRLEMTDEVRTAFIRYLQCRVSDPPNSINDVDYTDVLGQMLLQLDSGVALLSW